MNRNDMNPLEWPVKTIELTDGYLLMLIKAVRFYLDKNYKTEDKEYYKKFIDLEKYLHEIFINKES